MKIDIDHGICKLDKIINSEIRKNKPTPSNLNG